MSYLQNQIQHKKLGLDSETRFSGQFNLSSKLPGILEELLKSMTRNHVSRASRSRRYGVPGSLNLSL